MSSPSYQQKLPAEVLPSADPGAVETSFVQHLATPGNSESDSAGSGQRLVDEDTNPNDGVPRHGNPPTILAFDHLAPSLREAVVCSAFFVLTLAAFATSYVLVEPHQRPMPIQRLQGSNETVRRLSNNETYKGETIDTLSLLVLCGVCPFFIQCACNLKFGARGDLYRTVCTYSTSLALLLIVTEFIKNYVGYLRPIFFSECHPDNDYETCTNEDFDLQELHKSFISGHASFAFWGCTLFTTFLERTFGLSSVEVAVATTLHRTPSMNNDDNSNDGEEWQPIRAQIIPSSNRGAAATDIYQVMYLTTTYRKAPGFRRMGSILALAPMGVAVWVACSRVVDNMHFPADIVGGSVVGVGIAAYCHPLWFPDPKFSS